MAVHDSNNGDFWPGSVAVRIRRGFGRYVHNLGPAESGTATSSLQFQFPVVNFRKICSIRYGYSVRFGRR